MLTAVAEGTLRNGEFLKDLKYLQVVSDNCSFRTDNLSLLEY